MTEPTPETPPQNPAPTGGETPPVNEPPADGRGSKDAILADLSKERGRRQALEQQMTEIQAAQQRQQDALAKAFGLKDGEKPEADKLAEQVNSLQARIDKAERESRRLSIAAEHEIPKNYHHLLTATDDETLTAQATAVAELVKGRQSGSPAPDPTQGAQPTSAEAAAEAEYEAFAQHLNIPIRK